MVHCSDPKRIWKTGHPSNHACAEDAMKRSLLWASLLFASMPAVRANAANLPFIQDDFGKARAAAIERKLPIFVECWAPW
jgi:hypothetical protein